MEVIPLPPIEDLVKQAQDKGATTIFLVPGKPLIMRINGAIQRMPTAPLKAEAIEEMALAVCGQKALEKIGGETGDLKKWYGQVGVANAILSVARSHGQYTMTLQLLRTQIPTPEEVRLPAILMEASLASQGLIIISGLSGSGKSTSAYVLLDYINAHKPCHICTVEDPIAHHFPERQALIQQRAIGIDIPNTMAGIHAAMNQDFDVLFISEVRSPQVLQACITAAEMGHLVITVLHSAATPQEAIQRMLDALPDEFQETSRRGLAKMLRVVSTQVLLPKATQGRTAAYSVLVPDTTIRRAIANGDNVIACQIPSGQGSQTLAQDIEKLLQEQEITAATANQALAQLY